MNDPDADPFEDLDGARDGETKHDVDEGGEEPVGTQWATASDLDMPQRAFLHENSAPTGRETETDAQRATPRRLAERLGAGAAGVDAAIMDTAWEVAAATQDSATPSGAPEYIKAFAA